MLLRKKWGNPFKFGPSALMEGEDLDRVVLNGFQEIGLTVGPAPGASEYFNVVVSQGNQAPFVNVVRPRKESPFYLVGMGIQVHPAHVEKLRSMDRAQRESLLSEIRYALLMMNLDYIMLPVGSEVPEVLRVQKLFYVNPRLEGTSYQFFGQLFNDYTLVRNGGLYAVSKLLEKLGAVTELGERPQAYMRKPHPRVFPRVWATVGGFKKTPWSPRSGFYQTKKRGVFQPDPAGSR